MFVANGAYTHQWGLSCPLYYVLWSPDFGIGVFHDLSRMNFSGNELLQGAW